MSKEIIVLSRCVRKLGTNQCYEFHFKGVYKGVKIKKIIVESFLNKTLVIDHEYLLKIKFLKILNGSLYGELIQLKDLENIYINL